MKTSLRLLPSLIVIFMLALLLTPNESGAQEEEKQPIQIAWHGLIKADYIFDSRQTVSAREGNFLLYAAKKSLDEQGNDIHAGANFNILAIQTRLSAGISGPDFFGAKTSGLIEGAFFGQTDKDINGFRLRHAFVKLQWAKSNLIMGQYWHPFFVTDCFPGVYSFNTGVPFQPFSRNPQIRFSTTGKWQVIAALLTQLDFPSKGPSGASSQYLRNTGIPNGHLQFRYKSELFLTGVGTDYKVIQPRTINDAGLAVNEQVAGLSFFAYARVNWRSWSFKLQGVQGENLADQLMLGGIAEVGSGYTTGNYTYQPVKVSSIWTDLRYAGKKVEGGVFFGRSNNLGTESLLTGEMYGNGNTVAYVWRLAPSAALVSGNTRLGLEIEYTAAQYGICEPGHREIIFQKKEPVSNMRLLAFASYTF